MQQCECNGFQWLGFVCQQGTDALQSVRGKQEGDAGAGKLRRKRYLSGWVPVHASIRKSE